MATELQHKGSRREYIIFTLLTSIIVGYFSVISDHLYPILSSGNAENFIVKMWLLLAVILNDFAMWLLLATLIGWRYGTKLRTAIFNGILFAVFAILIYLVLTPVLYPGDSRAEGIGGYITWFGLSVFGGAAGGAMGYFAKKWPLSLAPLAALAVFRMMEVRSWSDWLGISRNLMCFAILLAVFIFWCVRLVGWIKTHKYSQIKNDA
jgi:hypothetical protein